MKTEKEPMENQVEKLEVGERTERPRRRRTRKPRPTEGQEIKTSTADENQREEARRRQARRRKHELEKAKREEVLQKEMLREVREESQEIAQEEPQEVLQEVLQEEPKEVLQEVLQEEPKEVYQEETAQQEESVQSLKVLEEEQEDEIIEIQIQDLQEENEVIRLDEIDENEIAEFFSSFIQVARIGLTKPIEAMQEEQKSKYQTKYLMMAIYFVLIFVTTSIHVPAIQGFVGLLGRMKLATAAVVFHVSILLIMSILIYIIGNHGEKRVGFKQVIGAFSIAATPAIILHMTAFLVGYVSVLGSGMVFIVSVIYWILLSLKIAEYFLNGDTVKANLVLIIISLFVSIVLYFAVKMYILSVVTSALEASVTAVQSSDGSVTGGVQTLVQELVTFLRNLDTLLGTSN